MKLTGRVCDCCGVDEPLQKFYTLTKTHCAIGEHDVLLCHGCLRDNIYRGRITTSIQYTCTSCTRDKKLNDILN